MADEKRMDNIIKKFDKGLSKFDDAATDLQNIFRGFSVSSLEKVAQSAMGMTKSLENFMDSRRDSLSGFSKSLNSSFRATQKWADRVSYDINTFAENNIRSMRDGIDAFKEPVSEVAKSLETRLLELSNELMSADQEQATKIRSEMLAIRDASSNLNDDEKARLEYMTDTVQNGMESIASAQGILKGAIMDTLPSLDKMAENVLGGGIMGKFAGSLIRRRRERKEATAITTGRVEQAQQQDAVNESDNYQAKLAQMSGGVDYYGDEISEGDVESAQLNAQTDVLREMNQNIIDGLGVRSPGYLHDLLDTMADDDGKEEAGEEARAEEVRHDELIAALGGDDKGDKEGGGGGGFLKILAATGKALGKGIQGLLTGLAKGIGAFGNAKVFKGIIAIGLLGIALVPFAFGLKQFTGIDFKQVFIGAEALVAFAVAAGVMGMFATQMLMGALAIAALGVALIPFAFAIGMFAGVSWKDVFIGLGALAAFAVVAAAMGLVIPLILAGSLAIAALGVALIPFAYAMTLFADAAEPFARGFKIVAEGIGLIIGAVGDTLTRIIDKFIELAHAPSGGLLLAAAGIGAVTIALAAFMALEVVGGVASSVGNVIGSVGDWVSGWFGGEPSASPMDVLGALTSFGAIGAGIEEGAKGIYSLIDGIQAFGAVEIDGDSIHETIGVVSGLAGAVTAFMTNKPGALAGLGDLIGGGMKKVSGWFGSLLGIESEETKGPLEVLQEIAGMGPQFATIGPAIGELTAGMMAILTFQNADVSVDAFSVFMDGISMIPEKALDAKSKAVSKLADAISQLSSSMTELDSAGGIGLVFNSNQDINNALRNSSGSASQAQTINTPIQSNNVVNNNQSMIMPINTRNTDSSLNSLRNRRF